MTTGGTFTSGATPILATVGGPVGIATAATSSALIAGGTIAAAHGIVLHKNYDKLNFSKEDKSLYNKINHVFGENAIDRHKLKPLLKSFKGNKKLAFNSLQKETQKLADRGIIKNVFEVSINVKNTKVVVQRKVINGKVHIGTAYIS